MKVASCHPERPLYCKEKCKHCYEIEYYLEHRKPLIAKLYDVSKEKQCARCKEIKALTEFSHRKKNCKPIPYCKSCRTILHKEEMKNDPSIYRRVQWPSKIKKAYGITPADYYRMLAEQNGCCNLCGSDNPNSRGYKHLKDAMFCIDHSHSTKKVRGLLCTGCNRAIGLIKDNPQTAINMAEYLNKEY
jgi:hypothetical protein